MSPSGVHEFRWLLSEFVPKVGELYDELAKVRIVPRVSRRGAPKQSRLTWPLWAAIERRRHPKRSMFEIGVLIEARGDREAARAMMTEIRQLPKESKRRADDEAKLKKLGRRYVKEGQRTLAQRDPDGDWPPKPDGKHPVSSAILRKHFQEVITRAIARWLAGKATPNCETNSPYYTMLMEMLNETAVMSGLVGLMLADDIHVPKKPQRRA